MVARGDLGVEVGDAELVGIQKRIIQHARTLNKVVITATQMMESMISSPMPTRAEVSDVANAVLDYTDAVMLSAESASGQYPVETVQAWRASVWERKSIPPRPSRTIAWARRSRAAMKPSRWPPCTPPTISPA